MDLDGMFLDVHLSVIECRWVLSVLAEVLIDSSEWCLLPYRLVQDETDHDRSPLAWSKAN
jgi:hypothetical protein